MKNRKGFMLAELVVSATVVISTMVGLYALYGRIYHSYKQKTNYYYVDGVYAIQKVIDLKMRNNNFSTFVNDKMSEDYYFVLIDGTEILVIDDDQSNNQSYDVNDDTELIIDASDSELNDNSVGTEGLSLSIAQNDQRGKFIGSFYEVQQMIIVRYDACSLQGFSYSETCKDSDGNDSSVRNYVENQTFKEYIDYIVKYYNIDKSSDDYDYIVLAEIIKNGKSYYSSLRIR